MLLLIGSDDGRIRCAGMLDGYQQQRYVEATSCEKDIIMVIVRI
jgi:hypothetical protein